MNEYFKAGFEKVAGVGLVIDSDTNFPGKENPGRTWNYSEKDVFSVIADQAPDLIKDVDSNEAGFGTKVMNKKDLSSFYRRVKKIKKFDQHGDEEFTKKQFTMFKNDLKRLLKDKKETKFNLSMF